MTEMSRMLVDRLGKSKSLFMTGEEELLADIKYWISSGCYPLDAIIGKGIPGGRLIELYGNESTGKSLLALCIIKEMQRNGGVGLLLDCEMTNSRQFMEMLGVDTANLIVAYPTTIGEVYGAIIDFLKAKEQLDKEQERVVPAVLVWDSIASTPSAGEVEGAKTSGLDKRDVAPQARDMSKMLRLLPRELSRAGVTAIFINQVREKIGVMFGDKDATTGGNALKFYASLRLKMKNVRPYKMQDEEGSKIGGYEVACKVVKSKVDRPLGICKFPILFNQGIDNATGCFWYLKELGLLQAAGSWYKLELAGEEQKFQKTGWEELFLMHEEEIRALIMTREVIREDNEEDDE